MNKKIKIKKKKIAVTCTLISLQPEETLSRGI
jgi:hypothetical protein